MGINLINDMEFLVVVIVGIWVLKVIGVNIYIFNVIIDMCGSFLVGEFECEILFVFKCYFLVYDVFMVEICGEYVYIKCYQFLIVVKGLVYVVVDDGNYCEQFVFDKLNFGLYLLLMIWGIQYKYFEDVVLLVFVLEFYDLLDYICEYGVFIELV